MGLSLAKQEAYYISYNKIIYNPTPRWLCQPHPVTLTSLRSPRSRLPPGPASVLLHSQHPTPTWAH
jgi:hypothetical protein